MKKYSGIKKVLLIPAIFIIISKLITLIWWEFFAYYWDTPIYKIIEALEVVSSTPFLVIAISYFIFLFLCWKSQNDNKTKSNQNNIKSQKIINFLYNKLPRILFLISIIILGALVLKTLLSPIIGYHCSSCGFSGGGDSGTTYYGLKALKHSLMFLPIFIIKVPIYLFSLIYIIFYISNSFIKK